MQVSDKYAVGLFLDTYFTNVFQLLLARIWNLGILFSQQFNAMNVKTVVAVFIVRIDACKTHRVNLLDAFCMTAG